jgi:hypothetical protein
VDWDPLVASVPVQPPDAVQEVALVEVHVRVALLPDTTVVGLAPKLTVGAGVVTVTLADAEPLPPVPVQVSVKDCVAVRAPVDWDPLVPKVPDQPPEAVQEVALVDVHVRVELLPDTTLVGLAVNVTVGAGVVTATLAI